MLYPIAGHPLLSTAAAALTEDQLDAHGLAAETAIGLFDTAYTGDKANRAAIAVVRQVNLQVAQPATGTLRSEKRGERAWEYAIPTGSSAVLDEIALAIVAALAEEAIKEGEAPAPVFAPITSFR